MQRRTLTNFVVDTAAFVLFLLILSTGLLLKGPLPPGSHGSTVWGLGRHDWGQVHFVLSLLLLLTMAVHVYMHWRWMWGMVRGRTDTRGRAWRTLAGLVVLGVVLALAVAPLLAPVRTASRGGGAGRGRGGYPAYSDHGAGYDEHAEHDEHAEGEVGFDTVQIRGSTTLAQMQRITGVPVAHVLRELSLPTALPANTRLGYLRQEYGIEMSVVRRVVADYEGSAE
jgi:hypothetical protein